MRISRKNVPNKRIKLYSIILALCSTLILYGFLISISLEPDYFNKFGPYSLILYMGFASIGYIMAMGIYLAESYIDMTIPVSIMCISGIIFGIAVENYLLVLLMIIIEISTIQFFKLAKLAAE